MGYFARVAVARVDPDGPGRVRVSTRFHCFGQDALVSWESDEVPTRGEWTALSPGTLYVSALPDNEGPETVTVLDQLPQEEYQYDGDFHGYHEHERLLLHVVLPRPLLPTSGRLMHDRDFARDRDCYIRKDSDVIAITFWATGRLHLRLRFRQARESEWQTYRSESVLRTSGWTAMGRAAMEMGATLGAKLISELLPR